MKALKTIVITVGILLGLLIVVGLILPSSWEVSRSETMDASAERIYASISNLHKWLEWSPWTTEHDPSLVYTYEGPEEGVGAQQNWTSDKMGTGWLRITEADALQGISYQLFIDMGNFQSTINGNIAYEDNGEKTLVTWTDRGDSGNNIIKKWMSLFMKPMLGKELDKGLKNLKALVEKN